VRLDCCLLHARSNWIPKPLSHQLDSLPLRVFKMAPRTAASACWCTLFCFVLHFNSVFCDGTRSSFTREELMNIRVTSPEYLSPTFLLPSQEIGDILVKGVLTFAHAVKRRRRGKRAFVLVRLCQRGLRTPLSGIILSNMRSLSNKLDELQLLLGKNRDFSSSAVLCLWCIGDGRLQTACV